MSKLIKIIFEYSNGDIRTLSGHEADAWYHLANCAVIIGMAPGANFPKFEWKETKKKVKVRK